MIIKNYTKFLESLQSKGMWDIIPESAKELHSMFKSANKKLVVVGGSVRDYLNNENPKDFDLATDATPDEVLSIIGKKWRTTTQGESFFVVVVYTEDQPKGMEIATFREDVYGDLLGKTRNPVTKFSTIEKDVERRDITYNALFYDMDQRKIIDLVNGIEDINNKITRFVGDPNMRIKEDPLRIFRLLRFTTRYGFTIDQRSVEAIENNKDQLQIIVHIRIWEEFFKAYGQVKRFDLYLKYIDQFDLWAYLFPGMKINHDIMSCKSLECYLANLFKDEIVDDFTRFQNRLVQQCLIPGDIAQVVTFLIWFQLFTPDKIVEYFSKRNNYRDSNNPITNGILSNWISVANLEEKHFKEFITYRLTTSAQELMGKGFKGKALGDEIKRIEIEKFKQKV